MGFVILSVQGAMLRPANSPSADSPPRGHQPHERREPTEPMIAPPYSTEPTNPTIEQDAMPHPPFRHVPSSAVMQTSSLWNISISFPKTALEGTRCYASPSELSFCRLAPKSLFLCRACSHWSDEENAIIPGQFHQLLRQLAVREWPAYGICSSSSSNFSDRPSTTEHPKAWQCYVVNVFSRPMF